MPDTIACEINKELQKVLSSPVYDNWHGVAEPIVIDEETRPVIISEGQSKSVFLDQREFLAYHRTVSMEALSEDTFGGKKTEKIRAEMRFIMVADANVHGSKEQLTGHLLKAWPWRLSNLQKSELELNQIEITPGRAELSVQGNWSEEFNGAPFDVTPTTVMISLPYEIEFISCRDLC